MEHIIKNFDRLAISPLRRQTLIIAEEGFRAINTGQVFAQSLCYDGKKDILTIQGQKLDLKKFSRVFVLAFGKAALDSAKALESLLNGRIIQGYVIDVEEGALPKKYSVTAGSHPLPSQKNIIATKEAVEGLSRLTETDLVICAVSGGGSSLFTWPYELPPEAVAELFRALTKQGADINELNTVRKHIDRVKGGNLAKLFYPATVINLLFSDVPGDDLSIIASGPAVKDKTTVHDASAILKKFDALEACGLHSVNLFETPKEEKYFTDVKNYLLLSPMTALRAMKEKAEDLGFDAKIFSDRFQGQARALGAEIVAQAKKHQCLIGAGESTVKIAGKGKGGRNQEMALGALENIKDSQVLVCLASDGYDNTDAAGAVVDYFTKAKAKRLGLEPKKFLDDNDSYRFFEKTDDLVFTGLTESNVSDFFILLEQ